MPYEKVMYSFDKDDWTTPRDLFDSLDQEFHFTVDLCASEENALCSKYYSLTNDGMKADLTGERVYCNPPYGRKSTAEWIKKCSSCGADVVVMLIPARTDTKAFHEYILGKAEIRFLQGRLHFGGADRAPFPLMIVIFRNVKKDKVSMEMFVPLLDWKSWAFSNPTMDKKPDSIENSDVKGDES